MAQTLFQINLFISSSLKEVKQLDSKELIRTFMMKPDLYINIEMVMQANCVKSVDETMISKYNNI